MVKIGPNALAPTSGDILVPVLDNRNGTVQVNFEVASHGEGCPRVRDDGIGMSATRPGSTGMELVRRLAQQIGGRL